MSRYRQYLISKDTESRVAFLPYDADLRVGDIVNDGWTVLSISPYSLTQDQVESLDATYVEVEKTGRVEE